MSAILDVVSPVMYHRDPHHGPTTGWLSVIRFGQVTMHSQTEFPDWNTAADFSYNLVDALVQLGERHEPSNRSRWKMEMLHAMGMRPV